MAVGKVKRVTDGDTFVLAGGERVRIANLDAPELGEKGGQAGKKRLQQVLPKGSKLGSPNLWQNHTIGQYGR